MTNDKRPHPAKKLKIGQIKKTKRKTKDKIREIEGRKIATASFPFGEDDFHLSPFVDTKSYVPSS